MLTGELTETVAVLERLRANGVPLYALTNWNAETFVYARERYAFLKHFRGIVVSGEEHCVKPEPTIYRRLFDRYQLAPSGCVFIDDSEANVQGARAVGMHTIHFQSAGQLERELSTFGFPL
jgi:2-haloacid dehalogenase